MVTIVVVTHGEAAPPLIATCEMILGEVKNTHTVTFPPGQGPDDLLDIYAGLVEPGQPVLFLVDLFGGSPYNAAARFVADNPHGDVVAGVNIPMLMEVTTANKRDSVTLDKLVKVALTAGATGVRAFKAGKASAPKPQPAAPAPTPEPVELDLENFPRDPDAIMNCIMLRIDSRLIHGQVAGAWVGDQQPQTLIAASDAAAKDTLRKELLLQVGPASARTNVLDIAKTIRVYFNPEYKGMRTMIVVETPQDALALITAGVAVKEINVGGVTYTTGMTQVSEAVYTNEEQLAAYKELHALGIPMVLQQVPTSSRINLMDRLREKGLV